MKIQATQILSFQKKITFFSICILLIKLLACYYTNSQALLSDALEAVVNVFAAFMGLYGLWLSNQPKDSNHPYGHGKIEFLTAFLESALIMLAGIFILIDSISHLFSNYKIHSINIGLALTLLCGLLNYALGYLSEQRGHSLDSIVLISGGKHLKTDSYTSFGLLIGLALIKLTNWFWIDVLIALLISTIIIYQGYDVFRKALAGLMDETHKDKLSEVAQFLEVHKKPNWIDIQNLKMLRYGNKLHIDCHLILPWFLSVRQAEEEIIKLEKQLKEKFGKDLEMFIRVKACEPFSCSICLKNNQINQSNGICSDLNQVKDLKNITQ